jgi:hypothetical protein
VWYILSSSLDGRAAAVVVGEGGSWIGSCGALDLVRDWAFGVPPAGLNSAVVSSVPLERRSWVQVA